MLDYLIKNGQDASTLILGSRRKAQRLLDTLGSGQGGTEVRLLAARIVADLAGGIHLAQFPGSILCVASLLEVADHPYCINPHQNVHFVDFDDSIQQSILIMEMMLRRRRGSHDSSDDKELELVGSCCCDELIVQGLTILQRLGRDPHNCKDICHAPGLLVKITAPIHSHTLIHDMAMNPPWADITNCSLGVVHQLIHIATGKAGRKLRRQISSNKQAITNLEGIIDGGSHQLQMRAMEILSELVLDSSLNISKDTRENLVRKQLQIFLADGDEQEQEVSEQEEEDVDEEDKEVAASIEKTPINNKEKEKTIKATAGETLSNLSNKIQIVSRFVMEEHSDIVDRLTQMLHPKNNIRYRSMSAQILENLCIHCKEHVSKKGGILLPKVLAEILATKTKPEASGSIPRPDDNEGTIEFLQRKTTSDNFALAVRENAPDGALVEKLKAIVDDNCNYQATPVSLKIVKLCSQISRSLFTMREYCTDDQKERFVGSFSKASNTLAKLEGCILFAGTGRGIENTVRPLLSDLEEQLKKEVA
ncbi:hypothetical protein GUJ93_ZPchr0011g27749 [Zizania palustris]|uniref:Uncharacterized protein n=1 Tax=Zizania palustris TaxID=103762 RepID=A0A8J5WJC2_ZIZPA|nr:hypothetical protein GUJ93_ZPchr0011g27749 [Zizania palustris]